jgi:dihydrofolate synthase/folylpolyglutamate synthase
MKSTTKQTATSSIASQGKQRSYNEVIEFLDNNWNTNTQDTSLSGIKQLDQAFESPSQKLKTILVAGTNGKSLTIHFTAKLLRQEGLSVGAFSAPHILTYNERFSLNNEAISNKAFTELANDVINTAQSMGLTPNSYDILTMMALLFFKQSNVDVALLEVSEGGLHNATAICSPKIAAITRVTPDNPAAMDATIKEMLGIVKQDTIVISGDQSKLNLQTMLTMTEELGGVWAMPIRKLAPLSYPFEQLHGRCAALAERIAQTFVNEILKLESTVVSGSLLSKPKGTRGRPTLEAKRQAELNPQKTLEQFWKEEQSSLPARFQLLDKEKPSILLDNAQNLDAFENLLLGIRLLHYQRPLKGLTIILGCNNDSMDIGEFLKQLRYFFKKTSGQVIVCPVEKVPGHKGGTSWDVEKITNDIKSMKIKARSCANFKEAFDAACKSVDERHGLVVVTGSPSIVTEYWRHKGMKKL